jgi:hypothetical protein
MTDLDTFRQALQAPGVPHRGAPDPAALDIDKIMARGRRIRRRRRLAACGGSVCLAAGLISAVTGISHLGRQDPSPAQAPAASVRSPVPSPVPSSVPARPSPVPSASPVPPVPAGRVIPAGIRDQAGELVFFVVRIHLGQLPGTGFGIMAGHRAASGTLTGDVETNETTGSATAPGFHAVESPIETGAPGTAIPEFGYYAGPAATITASVNGKPVQASIARWNLNPQIVIFWFPATARPSATAPYGLTAYDASGHLLPAGHNNTPGNG